MASRERYIRDPFPIRLGNLASNMAHIRTFCQYDDSMQETVGRFIRESMWFIEWTGPEAEVEVAGELVEIQVQLAGWYYSWQSVWNDIERRRVVAEQAGKWSDRILDLSGLLNDETYDKYNIARR